MSVLETIGWSSAGSLVVVAPHPDDETLAAGGLMFDLVRAGWQVSIVVITDGAASHPDIGALPGIRARECRRAAATLGVLAPPIFLGFPDGQACEEVAAVATALTRCASGFDVLVGPRTDDVHCDHVATALAIELAFSTSATVQLHYAIWGWDHLTSSELNLESAESYRPTDEAQQAKRTALHHYESQVTDRYGCVIVDERVVARHTADTEVFW